MSDGRSSEPLERPLHKWLCIFADAGAMSNDQLVEIPRKQFLERLPREVAVREGEPDIEGNTAARRCNALQLEQSIAKAVILAHRMTLDEIIQDDRARLFMKEKNLFDEGVALEGKLIEVILPGSRGLVPQNAREGQVPFSQGKRGGTGRPQLGFGK